MCVINNCDKEYCLHFSMAVRERVALFIFIVISLLINNIYCLPRNLSRMPKFENKVNQLGNVNSTEAGVRPNLRMNSRNQNIQAKTMNYVKQENVCEKFNFPEMEYPSASTPNTPFHFRGAGRNSPQKNSSPTTNDNNDNNRSQYPKLHSSTAGKNWYQSKAKNNPAGRRPENNTLAEFSSAPNYRDMGVFPELEYPQHANEMWRPNYWNCPPKVVQPIDETSNTKTNADFIAFQTAKSSPNQQLNKTKSVWGSALQNQNLKPNTVLNTNQISSKNQYDATNWDFPYKESFDQNKMMAEVTNYDNLYQATPMPQSAQNHDLVNTAVYAKICSNIANKAITSIKNILKSDKSASTEHHDLRYMKESDILEDILSFSNPNFDDYDLYSLLHNNYYATTQRPPREYSYSSEVSGNVTESWVNVFTAFTEKPFNQETLSTKSDSYNINYSQSSIIDTTSSSYVRDVINTPDTTTLSPRAFIYDDRKCDKNASILGQYNKCDVSELDKAAVISYCNDTHNSTHINADKNKDNYQDDSFLKLDEEYTTDVPEINENGPSFVSTVAPVNVSMVDPSWSNSDIIDPYKSASYPDELEECYIPVG